MLLKNAWKSSKNLLWLYSLQSWCCCLTLNQSHSIITTIISSLMQWRLYTIKTTNRLTKNSIYMLLVYWRILWILYLYDVIKDKVVIAWRGPISLKPTATTICCLIELYVSILIWSYSPYCIMLCVLQWTSVIAQTCCW